MPTHKEVMQAIRTIELYCVSVQCDECRIWEYIGCKDEDGSNNCPMYWVQINEAMVERAGE